MTDLQQAFVDAGVRNVRTVIASGNVIFEAPATLGAARARILRNVGALMGGDPVIVFRTLSYLDALVDAAPFGPLTSDRALKLYVLFLAGKPKRTPPFPFLISKDALEVRGMHQHDALVISRRKPSGMYGFPGLWTDQEMGVASTARTWSTILRLVKRPV